MRRILFVILCIAWSFFLSADENTEIAKADIGKYGPVIVPQKIDGPNRAMGAFVQNNMLYAVGDGGLYIYDISKALSPQLVGQLKGLGNVRQIVVNHNTAYIAAREFGMWIVNVANPQHPEIISHYDTLELATGIDVAENIAFVALRQLGVEVIDVSDSQKPKHLALFKTNEAQSVVCQQKKLFVGNWAGCEMTAIDVANPACPQEISITKLSGYGDGLAIQSGICYAATGHHARVGSDNERKNNGHGLDVIDISDLKQPKLAGSIRFPSFFSRGEDYWTVRVAGNNAVVADANNGAFVVDIADSHNPAGKGQIRLPEVKNGDKMRPDSVSGIALGDNAVYLAGTRTGLFVAPVPGIEKETPPPRDRLPVGPVPPPKDFQDFYRYDAKGQVRAVAIDGDIAYAAAGQNGLHIVRLCDDKIEPLAIHPLQYAYDVKLSDGKLYVAEGPDGIGVYRIDPQYRLTLLGRYKLDRDNPAHYLWVPQGSHYGIVSSRGGVLSFVDISDPAKMTLAFTHRQMGILYNDLLCDQVLGGRYIANNWHSGGLAWYDIGGAKPVLANNVEERLNGNGDGLCVLDGKLLMLNFGKYVLLAPNQPGPSKDWKRYSTGELFSGIPRASGHWVVTSDRLRKTVKVYDFSNPTAGKLIAGRSWTFDNPPGTVYFWHDRLVIPLAYDGLLLEKKNNQLPTH